MVKDREDKVIRVLVLVPVLEGQDLEHDVRKQIRDAHRDPGPASTVQALARDFDLDEVVPCEMGSANVERTQACSREFTLWTEDAAWRHLIRLAEEFHCHCDAIDVTAPPEIRGVSREHVRTARSSPRCSQHGAGGGSKPNHLAAEMIRLFPAAARVAPQVGV